MKIHNAKIQIASDEDHEKVYAEIYFEGEEMAVITQEEEIRISIFPHSSGKPWQLNFDQLLEILSQAKKHLVSEKD